MNNQQELMQQAQQIIASGVNSPVRAFGGVGGDPIFIKRGEGAYLIDEEDKRYIDYVGSWGPLILGHSHPAVIDAVQTQIQNGLSFGAPTVIETTLAQKICQLMPPIEKLRMVNSGTEATMTAIRLARGYTGRNKIIKFEGCYHGHSDSLLVKAGSGLLTFGTPSSAGVPASIVEHTLTATFNDLDSVTQLFAEYADDIAGVIVEPVAGNMNCIPGTQTFLQGLRDLCAQYQSVLIFDEVMSGFRVGLGGACELYQIKPDLCTLGKVIGGGMPVGAVGGKTEIMDCLSPQGAVYQAGTLSGNPIAMAAGLATLHEISQPDFYQKLTASTQQLTSGLLELAQHYQVPLRINQVGSMFGLFFTQEKSVTQFSQVKACDLELFKRIFHGVLAQGIYLAPSAFEAGFVSSAHGETEIEQTLQAFATVFQQL